jgi:hypothetical protein
MVHAELLADWIGAGRPVTPKGVLRPADIPAVASVLGVDVPARNRTAADVWVIHRPWVAALANALIAVDAGRATAMPVSTTDPLEAWWTALLAVLAEESHDRRDEGGAVLCRTLLTALAGDPPPSRDRLDEVVHELLHDMDVGRRAPCTRRSGVASCRSTAGWRSSPSSAQSTRWGG